MQAFLITIIRHSMTAFGATLASYGYIGQDDVNTLVGASVIAASAVWSYLEKERL